MTTGNQVTTYFVLLRKPMWLNMNDLLRICAARGLGTVYSGTHVEHIEWCIALVGVNGHAYTYRTL